MIQSEPESIERIRERICKMSDLELRQYRRAARDLANPKKTFGSPNPSFQIQLDSASAQPKRTARAYESFWRFCARTIRRDASSQMSSTPFHCVA
jgi:hypothetical protein